MILLEFSWVQYGSDTLYLDPKNLFLGQKLPFLGALKQA